MRALSLAARAAQRSTRAASSAAGAGGAPPSGRIAEAAGPFA
jgi:hypothetical protein